MHGLIFETSICYWQDQPGRVCTITDTLDAEGRRAETCSPRTTAELSAHFAGVCATPRWDSDERMHLPSVSRPTETE